jgi:hypothetical protein
MSYSILQRPEVKKRFARIFPLPKIGNEKKILVAPTSERYALIGNAFDYLFRFYLEKYNPNSVTFDWVAEKVLPMVKFNKELHKTATKIVCSAKLSYYDYLETGKMTDKLIENAILLAQLEPYYRDMHLYKGLGTINKTDIKELKQLLAIIPTNLFKTKKVCVLNPHFGSSSTIVNSPDADLLIDDVLVDIKTTRYYQIERRAYNQLIGYYLHYLKDSISGVSRTHKIKQVGIYFARFGVLHTIPVKSFTSLRGYKAFTKWFAKENPSFMNISEL